MDSNCFSKLQSFRNAKRETNEIVLIFTIYECFDVYSDKILTPFFLRITSIYGNFKRKTPFFKMNRLTYNIEFLMLGNFLDVKKMISRWKAFQKNLQCFILRLLS